MAVIIDGTNGVTTPAVDTQGNLAYTGTLTGGTGVINIGSGQLYKDASGNVGIGTSSPSLTLQVEKSGNSSITIGGIRNTDTGNAAGAGFAFGNNASAESARIAMFGSNHSSLANTFVITNDQNGPVAFRTNGTERMRIDSSGNLLVGGTGTYDSSRVNVTYANFDSGNQTRPGYAIGNVAGTEFSLWRNETDSGGNPGAFFRASSGLNLGVVMVASTNGVRLAPNGTSWGSYSDERLKNITGEISNALGKVSQIRAVYYALKNDERQTPRVGVIAQDVQKVMPEVVDADTDFLQVRYSELVPLCLKAIQEQQAIIESQTAALQEAVAEINSLKARVEALEGAQA